MVVNPLATGAVYLFLAAPPTVFAARRTARPWAAGLFGAVVAIALTTVLNPWLPFEYWTHARDFVIEPFLEGKLFRDRGLAAATIAFHLGVPVAIAFVVHRWFPRDELAD